MPDQIHDHQILRPVTGIASQQITESRVFVGSVPPADCSLDGPRLRTAFPIDAKKTLRRCRCDLNVIQLEESRVRRRIRPPQCFVVSQRRYIGIKADLIGQAKLVAFPRSDQRETLPDFFQIVRAGDAVARNRRGLIPARGDSRGDRSNTPLHFIEPLFFAYQINDVLKVVDCQKLLSAE